MPAYVLISKAKMHDAKVLALLRLNPSSIVAMDRAYNDYKQFARWTEDDVYFVTRMKDNAVYEAIEKRDVPLHRNILSDEIILLTGAKAQEKCPYRLRRIVVWDEDNQREIVLLTNQLEFGATTIADIYKERWQIELFFKALKQNLRVKSFVGTSENALRIQIWTALIALLLLKWLCITFPERLGRCPILPPCFASTSLPIGICAIGSTTHSTRHHSNPCHNSWSSPSRD
jgi:IS4 transposase